MSCADDDLPPAMLSLWEKMEKALSLLKNSLGIGLQNLPYPHLCVPNSTLLEYRQLEGRKGFHVQSFLLGYGIVDFQNGLQMYVITDRVNTHTYQMPSLVE